MRVQPGAVETGSEGDWPLTVLHEGVDQKKGISSTRASPQGDPRGCAARSPLEDRSSSHL